jgi:hypothetical protein
MHVKTRIVLATLAGSLAILPSACSSKPQPPQGAGFQQRPQEYSFRVSGSLAEAGITFSLARRYEVGPAENGQVHSSRLEADQARRLQEYWDGYRAQAFTLAESCQDWPAESPWRESTVRIEILESGRSLATLRSDGGRLCGTGSSEQLKPFAESLLELARMHYPKVFPSECLALQDEFSERAETARSCTSDAQCTHVDPQFDAIPEGQIQYVSLKSCSPVPALPTANREELSSARRALLKLKDRIRQTCQQPEVTAACASADELGFQNHRHPARCIEGACSSGLEQ